MKDAFRRMNMEPHVSYSLNFLREGYIGMIYGTTIGDIKGDTRSLDCSSYGPSLRSLEFTYHPQ